jgi:hypothetical protein
LNATTTQRRALVATAVLAAACFTLATPTAHAAPKPEPQLAGVSGCPIDVHEFAAELRAAGFTAQAANNATQLTRRECSAQRISRIGVTFNKSSASGQPATEGCDGLQATLGDLESLTRAVHGRIYRQDGLYPAGAALTRELSARRCGPATPDAASR